MAHQDLDQTVNELSDEVYRQQRQITQLEGAVWQLVARLAAGEADQAPDRPVDETPPHY